MLQKGFTLIEILLVSAITVILIAATLPVYDSFFKQGKLDVASIELQGNLRNMQAQAKAGLNDLDQGAYFNSNSYIAYQGSSYVTRNTDYDFTYDIIDKVTIVDAPMEVTFSKKTGLPDSAQTITIRNQINDEETVINVSAIGLIE
jgi:prepilin-type N-terminal cleavage/methylation domain-containing protein